MKAFTPFAFLLAFLATATLAAQRPTPTNQQPTTISLPGTGTNDETNTVDFMEMDLPLDDIVQSQALVDKRVLPYEDLREADIMWKKRVWRVLDVKEKINLPFANPQRPLITILLEAAQNGKIRVFDPIGGLDGGSDFSIVMDTATIAKLSGGIDTVRVVDPNTYEEVIEYQEKLFDPTSVRRYRLQEMWFFDKESSTMKVRILGIAPLVIEETELDGRAIERPMFWIYYPEIRQLLANESAYAYGNDAANRSWEDVFESRYFNSYITKESNVQDRRISGYLESGRAQLMEAERIKQEIFNFEQDLWSY